MNISIIGTGNIAWHLAQVFEKVGLRIVEVYGRDPNKAIELVKSLYDSKVNADLDFSESEAEVFFLCVSDDAITEICSKILLPEKAILVHTSGAKAIHLITDTLSVFHDLKVFGGVFYPIMTFSKNKEVEFSKIPICIEAENKDAEKVLINLAKKISNVVYLINSQERLVLHVASVFACNFTNHLWAISKEIVESEELDFDLIKPLIMETFKKAMSSTHPAEVQTGPALRNDLDTILIHKRYLADDQDLQNVYDTLTESIKDWHNEI